MLIQQALQYLQEGNLDELQKELHKIEGSWRLCNRIREAVEQSASENLTQWQNAKLAGQETLQALTTARAERDQLQNTFQQQLVRINIENQTRLETLVNENVQLKQQVRALNHQLKLLQKQLDSAEGNSSS